MAAAARLVILPFLAVLLAVASLSVAAQGAGTDGAMPSFAELEAAGAVIGEVRIDTQDIFDLDDPSENSTFYRLANQLHIRTRPSVIRRALLFRSGERVSWRVIEETERVLRANDFLYDVSIRPTAYRDGIVDIEVRTRDTWTLQPGVSFSRGGGSNSSGVSVQEKNLFGTGVAVGFARTSTVDRTGKEYEIAHNQVFGGWTAFNLHWADYSDGSSHSISLVRPFYALDARWALGASAAQFDRIDSIYSNDTILSQFRHQQKSSETFGGWSDGLVEGWVQRYSVGVGYTEDVYADDPTRIPPAELPPDQTLAYPFIRYEVIEDRYVRVMNRDKIARPEFFAMGFNARVQLGYASTSFGSTQDLWLYWGSVSKGFASVGGGDLLTGASLSGQYGDGRGQRQAYSAKARYYRPHGQRGLFYAAGALDAIRNPLPTDQLLLGGDNGLRGYPMRYQSGDQRALFSVEERVYTDWYPFQLIRVGAAVFFDVGRAWGGPYENLANPGWLRDVGFGLRLLNARSSSGNVLHLDIAFPLDADASIKNVQYLVKTSVTF
jgi:outer membrane protein assembly factor BamA